jgi:cardiolipin synthase
MQKNIFDSEQYLPGNALSLVVGGEPFFVLLLQMINEAQHVIHFQVYIFDEDNTGKEVAEALKKASRRGVDIYLVVDSYGSKSLSPAFVADLEESGVRFKFFSPLPKHFYFFRLGRRLHNKAVVVDHRSALVGGINIADKYRGDGRVLPWLDFAIGIKGPVCVDLSRVCERIYREKYFGKLQSRYEGATGLKAGTVRSRLVVNDWFRQKNQISSGYRAACWKAQASIIIVASYFLPSRSMRRVLENATQRGVKVVVLLPGVSDLPMAKRATRYLYQWVLRNNIAIYEWDSSILHGKLAVVDHQWVTIGSFNLNHLSQYSSIEMNVEVLDEDFARSVQDHLSVLIQQSTPVTANTFLHFRSILDRVLDWGSYTLARWIMLFLFFLVRRDQEYREQV